MNQQLMYISAFAALAYLLGSIPSAVWIGKRFYNIDVREHGSRNAGTTNVLRVLGSRAAVPVLLIDVLKGLAAVLLAHLIPDVCHSDEKFGMIQIALGLLAVVGHMYPVFAGFRGGKGVATILGVICAIHPAGALSALAVFIVVFVATRIVSVGSLVGGTAFPLLIIFVFREPMVSVCVFSAFIALLLFYTHRKNIKRLLNGTEPKTVFKKKQEVK
jgi:glycerol-3-phosphate acyltransferase PlsY